MSEFVHADLADAEQAQVFREHFGQERDDLLQQLAKLTKQLTKAVTTGHLTEVGQLRRGIRRIESSLRGVDHMLDALNRRFPVDELRRRA